MARQSIAFSARGRVDQVEYGSNAIKCDGMSVAILASDGIVFAVEKKEVGGFGVTETIYMIHEDMVCSVAGKTSDAIFVKENLRLMAGRYMICNGEPIPCQQLITQFDNRQSYSEIFEGRHLPVSILYMGWDKYNGFQLYQSDSGMTSVREKKTSVDVEKNKSVISLLKQDYKDTMSVEEVKLLVVKILGKMKDMDPAKPIPEKLEIMTLTRVSNRTIMTSLKQPEIKKMIDDWLDKQEEAKRIAKDGDSK